MKNPTVDTARATLRRKGYSYRRAATALGCSFTHLSHVLTSRRESRRLLARIATLPESPIPYRQCGFAALPIYEHHESQSKNRSPGSG
ncbi:MAG: hypothetical protein WCS65_09540 [Verrucomicrobiae bacterium]